MELTIKLNVSDTVDDVAVGQLLHWAKRLEAVTEIKVPASGKKLASLETPSIDIRGFVTVEDAAEIEVSDPVLPTTTNGAAEPAAGPKRRGRKTNAEKAAIAAAAEAALAPADDERAHASVTVAEAIAAMAEQRRGVAAEVPPAVTKRPLPGLLGAVILTPEPTPAAMPATQPAGDDDEVSLTDVQECIRTSIEKKGPKVSYQIMARETWPDGTEKAGFPKRWHTVEGVPPEHYARLVQEIYAAMLG